MTTQGSGRSFLARISVPQWVAIVLTVLAIIFIVQNRQRESIDLFWVSVTAPLWLILVILFVVGWVVGFFMTRRRERGRQQKQPTVQ